MAEKIIRSSAVRRRRARAARLDFAAIEIVGALLTPDMVARIATESRDGYGIPLGLDLRDEMARYYRMGEALWGRFAATRGQSAGASARFVVDLLKQCVGFDSLERRAELFVGERGYPVGHAALGGRVPVVIAPAGAEGNRRAGVDESLVEFGDGGRRRSATLLAQEFLNASPEASWGIACDGLTLRILRDNVSMTRPAWVSVNLEKIFTEGLFPDFSALWLLAHQSRFGSAGGCSLEEWRERGRVEGVAAREHLRNGVTAALLELGQGFLENPGNDLLRVALRTGSLPVHAFYEELLGLIYRMIFLFVAEDRGLLHAPDATDVSRKMYAEGYALGRLRERALRRTSWDRHGDAWEGVKALHRTLASGEPLLGLPALGGLFGSEILPHLDNARLENRRLLAAVWRLCWLRPPGQALTRVNWRDMETEELGSVYESLLELIPRASADTRIFDFAPTEEGRGSARKTSGSYYTPDSLVKLLLDTTLDPVLDAAEARNPDDPAAEILKLSIIDPACGSGHFLLGAARRAAGRIAKWRSPGAPSQAEFQHALRQVVTHCIYGVDRNPMAVQLCRVALWIEALEAGKPLAFLDNHIRCGDSLVGVFDLEMLRRGIPDAAYVPLTGDAKAVAKAYERFNREGRDRFIGSLYEGWRPPEELITDASSLFKMPEETLAEVAAKRAAFERLHQSETWVRFQLACDCYVAAFFVAKGLPLLDPGESPIPLTEHVWGAIRGAGIPVEAQSSATSVSGRIKAFHWLLEFPDIFARGGFDAVIGNPPWERIKLQELEFFAARSPEIAQAGNKAERQKLIDVLASSPAGERLLGEFHFAKRAAEASSELARKSGRYPLTGTGDVNTYALFAELSSVLVKAEGRAGVVLPAGLATDFTNRRFFSGLMADGRLVQALMFDNARRIFPSVHPDTPFGVFVMGRHQGAPLFCAYALSAEHALETERQFTLTADQIARMNPNTKTAPVFRSRADAELTAKLNAKAPVLIEERPEHPDGDVNPWGITFQTLFHMSGDSGYFRTVQQLEAEGWRRSGVNWEKDGERRLPLYEAKMIHHFDHRWATYAGGSGDEEEGARDCTLAERQNPDFEPSPRYWVPEYEVVVRAARVPAGLKRGYRDGDEKRCLKALAEALVGYYLAVEGRSPREEELRQVLGKMQPWHSILGGVPEKFLRSPKTVLNGAEMQRATPLVADDLVFLEEGPEEVLELVRGFIDRKQPRWLMGWRDITNATNNRTVIASVFPRVGTGDTLLLMYPIVRDARLCAALAACMCSIALDYVCRQKIGGTHLKYNVFKQNAVLPPSAFPNAELDFVAARVLELSHTSHSMKPWAEDLGDFGPPYAWNEDRRALLRAELDAFFARKYGLTRDELRYVLDPGDVKGSSYPSETFRVLKNKEESRYGEYRTRRLVLDAWDRLENV